MTSLDCHTAAVVIVPGGFAAIIAPHLGDGARCIAQGTCGEAAVDFVLTEDMAAIKSLRVSPDKLPVIGVMALVATTNARNEGDLDALRDAVHHSGHWNGAMNLWRLWRRPTRACTHTLLFRATALREDGIAKPRVNDVARAAASGTYRRWQWTASMSAFDVEIVAVWLASSTALVGIPLTHGWDASKRCPGGFLIEAVVGQGGVGSMRHVVAIAAGLTPVSPRLLMYADAAQPRLCGPCGDDRYLRKPGQFGFIRACRRFWTEWGARSSRRRRYDRSDTRGGIFAAVYVRGFAAFG